MFNYMYKMYVTLHATPMLYKDYKGVAVGY